MTNQERKRRQEQSENAIQQNFRPKDASKYLGVGLSTVWLYIKQGKLKAHKLSPQVTILRKTDLDNFINGHNEVVS